MFVVISCCFGKKSNGYQFVIVEGSLIDGLGVVGFDDVDIFEQFQDQILVQFVNFDVDSSHRLENNMMLQDLVHTCRQKNDAIGLSVYAATDCNFVVEATHFVIEQGSVVQISGASLSLKMPKRREKVSFSNNSEKVIFWRDCRNEIIN